jgi:uncharacterized protein (DUF2164 family)
MLFFYVFRDSVVASMSRQEIPSKRGEYQKMPEVLDLKNAAKDVISSYEMKIESAGTIFDTTQQILNDFQETFFDRKEERQKINTQLRDILAHNEHLRNKDFDNMMQGILSTQEEQEKEVKNLLKDYLNHQGGMAHTLRENLAKFKDSLAKGEVQRVKEFQALIQEILAKQDERKNEVTSKLKEFQKQQQELAKRLKTLLAKGRELQIKDLKEMLQEFRTQHQERITLQEERRKDVQSMLSEFRKERLEAVKNWQDTQKKLAQKRACSP